MSGWWAALRVARREARRAKGRSALVVAMIALPVAVLTFGAATFDSSQLRPDEQADRMMGTGQAVMTWPYDVAVHQEPTKLFLTPAGGKSAQPPQEHGHTPAQLLALLPSGSTVLPDQAGALTMQTATGIASISARMLDLADPRSRGIYSLLTGRAPAMPDEVALTAQAASRLGSPVGGTVRLADATHSFRVVGIVEDPDEVNATVIVLHPGALPANLLSTDPRDLTFLVGTPQPITWDLIRQLNTHGVAAVSRYVLAHPPSQGELYPEFGTGAAPVGIIVLIGGLAMLEIILLAGPAFAVGARQRRRDLALVAAAGGAPAQLRRIVLADGVVLGGLAAIAGVAVGVAVTATTRSLVETHLINARYGGLRVLPLALVALAGLAIVTGVLAALVPAWIASRQDVTTALAGRRGRTRTRRRWSIVAVMLVIVGAIIASVGSRGFSHSPAGLTDNESTATSGWTAILIGLAIVEFGLVFGTPAIVSLVARLGRWLPLATRVALRDSSRNRTAAASAISAVMASVVASLAVGVILTAVSARARDNYHVSGRPGDVVVFSDRLDASLVDSALRAAMPVRNVHQVSIATCAASNCVVSPVLPAAVQCPYSAGGRALSQAEQRAAHEDQRCVDAATEFEYFGVFHNTGRIMTIIIDENAVADVVNIPAGDADAIAGAMRAGKVVVSDPAYLEDGRIALSFMHVSDTGQKGPRETRASPGWVMPHRPPVPLVVMNPVTATTLGLAASRAVTMASTSRMPTVAEQDQLQAALGYDYGVYVERGPGAPGPTLLILAAIAAVITLVAAAVATGLAAVDGRRDMTTLAAVGASPRLRRALSLSQAGIIAGLGSLLGTVAGLGAATAILLALNRGYADRWPAPAPYPIEIPWHSVGIALVVVPVIAMLGAGLLTRSRLPIERRL